MKTVLLALDDTEAIRSLRCVRGDGRNTKVLALSSDEALQHLRGQGRFSDRAHFPLPQAILCDPKSLARLVDSCKALQPSPRLYLVTNPRQTATVIQMMAQALR